MSAIKLLSACREKGWKLSRLAGVMERYPQVMLNVRATAEQKAKYTADEALAAEIRAAGESLGRDGRVLVRVSGTEPLLRVMVEGQDEALIEKLAQDVAQVIREELV